MMNFIEAEEPTSVRGLHRDLTLQIQQSYAETLEDLGRLNILFQIASGLLTVEVIFWIAAIALTF